MIRIFRDEISDIKRFVVTLELVPGTKGDRSIINDMDHDQILKYRSFQVKGNAT